MLRRSFISISAAAAGGLMIGRNCLFADAQREISKNLTAADARTGYDLLVIGAGIAGLFAAVSAARRGLKVLIAERRASPACEIAAKLRLRLKTDGFELWDDELKSMFFPEGERSEVYNPRLAEPFDSRDDDKLILFAGSVKKSFMRAIALSGADAMFMTDIFGVYTDASGSVCGAALATKQGCLRVNCAAILDASENNIFSRKLTGDALKISSAKFAAEFGLVGNAREAKFPLPSALNGEGEFYEGKNGAQHGYVEFAVKDVSGGLGGAERAARADIMKLARHSEELPKFLQKATLWGWAEECSAVLETRAQKPSLKNYFLFENPTVGTAYSCADIIRLRETAGQCALQAAKDAHRAKCEILNLADKKISAKIPAEDPIIENGKVLPFYRLYPSDIPASEKSVDILVAGMGTAGIFAARAAKDAGCEVLGVEYFNEFGGTRTLGGVSGFYHGVKDHPCLKNLGSLVARNTAKFNIGEKCSAISAAISEYLNDIPVITGAILCGAATSQKKFDGVFVCAGGTLFKIKSKAAIDSTGDSDIAAFAGVPFSSGDIRTGITQDYSQWDKPSPRGKNKPRKQAISKDYDLLDNSKISELQRGFMLSHYEARYYNFRPFLTVREIRRPAGIHTLTLREAVETPAFPDTIAQAQSDYDPHNYSTGALSRCAMLLSHFTMNRAVNIPYGCIVPKNLDGLLLCGRGISVEHDVYQFTRMSADVSALGYVEGQIAAKLAKSGISARDFDVSQLRDGWIARGYFVKDFDAPPNPTPAELAEKLSQGDAHAMLRACLKDKSEMLDALKVEFEKGGALGCARALAWFGDGRGADIIVADMKKNFEAELAEGSRSDYIELYARGNLKSPYWNVNKDIAFLALSGADSADASVAEILDKTTSGGAPHISDNSYRANRIDMLLVPNYNRIGNLCFYAEHRPNKIFAVGFEKLLDDKNIRGGLSKIYSEARMKAYRGLLEIFVASAAARCGSKKGAEVLAEYLGDQHAFFREFAHRDLVDIFGKDVGYTAEAWQQLAASSEGAHKPISKNFYTA